ncbi:hypothetical protein AVEN_252019-1 [Araneus ventricosus]|uniref:Uncharacterized protein n=1 Tax=Araneus ventricosus TaxID=182803 RepID=A0A4Y2WHM7_ARAVE|nr:hypothetical protein AVEN_252019-1 [Araneus ventricosus]
MVGASDEFAELGLANFQTWSGSNYHHQRYSSIVSFDGHILQIFPKDIDLLAFATYRGSSARYIVRTAMGIPAPPETDEQMLQLSEDHKDPDDVEETGNLLTLSLNVA